MAKPVAEKAARMLSEMMPFVERLVMAVECISYEVENISLHMKGMSHSLHDLNTNVSSLLKGKMQTNVSTLSSEDTDLLADFPPTEQVTVVEDQHSGQYRDEDESLEAQNNALSSEDTPFFSFIGRENHFPQVEHCEEPNSLSSASKVAGEVKAESIDISEDWSSLLGNSPICTSITTGRDKVTFAEPTKLLKRINNSNMTFTEARGAVYSENESEDSSYKDQVSQRNLFQNVNDSKRKLIEAFQKTSFIPPLSNTKKTRKEDNNESGSKESEKVLRETENASGLTDVSKDPKRSVEENSAWKRKEQGFLEPSTSLEQHDDNSYQKSRFGCETCGICFSTNILLERHRRIHIGENPLTCSLCNKPFASRWNLEDHMRVHSSENLFSCNISEKACKQPHHLNSRKRLHSEEKRFNCRECGKAFTWNSSLTEHLRIHSGEQPFSCIDCGKCFSQSSTLYRHRRQVHKAHCP